MFKVHQKIIEIFICKSDNHNFWNIRISKLLIIASRYLSVINNIKKMLTYYI